METKPETVQAPICDADLLFQTYADMVYRLAFLRLKSSADAEDILQEVFVRCLNNRTSFRDAEHQKAWLIRVTINCTKTLTTSAWRRHTVPERDNVLTEMEDHTDVYAAVLALPRDYRTAIHLYYYEGYSTPEIAALLNCSQSTIRNRLMRARNLLKTMLGGEFDEQTRNTQSL